jgi:hypothetical protein
MQLGFLANISRHKDVLGDNATDKLRNFVFRLGIDLRFETPRTSKLSVTSIFTTLKNAADRMSLVAVNGRYLPRYFCASHASRIIW